MNKTAPLFLLFAAVAVAEDPSTFDAGSENHLGLTLSPDGRTAYWVEWDGKWGGRGTTPRTIYLSTQQDGVWSPPVSAPFSGTYDYRDPFVSPDGVWLYFISDRPSGESDTKADSNIWRYNLVDKGPMGFLSVNSESEEYSPFVTDSGALYFASDREGGYGQGDIYRADMLGDGFGPPTLLGPNINSEFGEWNMWVAADESEMIFESSSRPTNISIPGDLYHSRRTPDGWTMAEPVTSLNSDGSDLMPRLHPDGYTLYYTTAPLGGHARVVGVEWRAVVDD